MTDPRCKLHPCSSPRCGMQCDYDEDYCRTCRAEKEVERLQTELERLRDGTCRFNCRTAKENWIEGYVHAVRVENPGSRYGTQGLKEEAADEYVAWRKRKQAQTATGRRKDDAV